MMAKKPVLPTFPNKPRNLRIGAELNRGAWGVVYNGELEGRTVAVKRIHELLQKGVEEKDRRKVFEDFQEECKKLRSLSHPHVVGFIGAFNDPRLGPILVMEKMQENLRQFLDKWRKKLQISKQLRISLEIIRGVAFLHQQTPPLVHRDLNDKNVMFSFEGVVKIGDFGQSKLKKDLYLTTGQPGMVIFMPPEALAVGKPKYNESLDIFSIGVLMLEIGTQQEPLVNLHGIGTLREVERREVDLKVLGEDHPLRQPVLLCLKDNPKERPKASDLQRDVLAMIDEGDQATANVLRSQITSLQTALAEAREENAERKEHEAEWASQFQKATEELAESAQQLQKERESQEEMVRRLKQQHQDEVAQLMAKMKDAEDYERRWRSNSEAVLLAKEEELRQVNEKLHDASQEMRNLQATAERLRSQNTNLQTTLAEAREENAAKTEHEAKLKSQFQADAYVASRDANIRQLQEKCEQLEELADVASRDANIRQLQEKCEQLEAQAMIYKLDFEQERSDRELFMGRFDEERQTLQRSIEKLNEKMKTMHLEHDETLSQLVQLKELSLAQKEKLREKEEMFKHASGLEQKLSKLDSKHETVIKENTALKTRLQSQEKDIKAFRAIEAAYQWTFDEAKTYKEMYHDAESKRSAAASRVTELTIVLNAMEEKGLADTGENVEALRDEIRRMKRHYDALEASCQRVTTEKHQLALSYQQLQRENEALRGRRIMTGEHEMSPAAQFAEGEASLFIRGPMGTSDVLPESGKPLGTDSQITAGCAPSNSSNTLLTAPTQSDDFVSMPPTWKSAAVMSTNSSSSFEADLRYIGEDINTEISHEAHRYRKSIKGVVTVPAQVDDQDWPLDPNLTCPYCKVVFRRGQMREYRLHIDKCQL